MKDMQFLKDNKKLFLLAAMLPLFFFCLDNGAYVESFFGSLKTELVHGERYHSRLEARLSIFEYVEVFYNRQRRHSALGYRSPEQYEKLLNET